MLPQGWVRTTLGELGRYINGRGFKKSEWSQTGRPILRIQNLTGSNSTYNYYSGELDDRHLVRPGDLLISWAATLGAYRWRGPESALNQHIFKVESFIDPDFHFHLINYLLDSLRRHTHGSGMVHITRGKFDGMPVMIPPLAEQRRIVEVLEGHLSRLSAAVESLTAVAVRSDRLRSRILASALDSAGGPSLRLQEVLSQPLINGRSVRTRDGGFPVLRLTALANGHIVTSERKEGDWDRSNAEPFLVAADDFLVSRGNGSIRLVGRGGLVPEHFDPVAFPDTMIRVRVDKRKIRPEYLRLVWHSRLVRQQIESVARTTAGIYKINQTMLKNVVIPVPSIEQQDRISERVEFMYESLDRATAASAGSVDRAGRLRMALLNKAFAGTLVSQDPTDEPAAKLLARIEATRDGKPKVVRARPPRTGAPRAVPSGVQGELLL
ncbi:restriction endonuclease subunit S [Nocardia salmonicida]|uniref:restriction endonuclease subunit S n=1 Tax=Nocardia salmonicida TaxID=53431 RepID=UPI003424A864